MFSSAHPYAHFFRLWLTVLALLGAWPAQAAFIDQGDGTVTDTLTDLIWDQCAWGQSGNACAIGSASQYSWSAAQSLAASANASGYRGHNDWRLPNVAELESLVNIDTYNPSIDSIAFPNTKIDIYWSSTVYTLRSQYEGLGNAWGVSFAYGQTQGNGLDININLGLPVRLVRGGQPFDSFDSLATQPSVGFVSSFISADEASRSATAIVTHSATTTGGAATVRYVTVNGTALAGTDYTATSGLLSWAAGESGPKSIIIPLTDDLLVKSTRQFSVLLSDPTGTLISGTPSATIEISDNDHNTPDPFSFTPQTGVALNATITSNSITVSGINAPATIAVSNGNYSVNGLPFVSVIGSVNSGDTVLVNILSASTAGAVRTAVLTIGGASASFAVTTRPDDITPDTFSFSPQTGVALNATITSNPITVSGINAPATIAVSNGNYSVNGLPFVSVISSVNSGDTVLVNILSASTAGAVRTAILTIAGVSANFTVTTRPYDITATSNPTLGGSASCTPNQVNHGGSSTCAATPASGYRFSAWSGDCTGATCVLSNVTAAKTVTASFTQNSYSVTASASPTAGGSASCTPNPVNSGSSSTCTATPAAGYTFSAWSGDCTGATCVLSNVTAAKAVTASFTQNSYALTATANPVAGGSASCTPNPVNSGGSSTCTAVAATGYHFTGWSGDCTAGSGTGSCSLTNVTAAKSVTAGFTANTYIVSANAIANGSISPTVQTINHGAPASFTITPNNGYGIASATGCGGGLSGKTYTTGPITANCSVTVVLSATPSNGACGTDSGTTPLSSTPSNLCTTGTASLVYGNGPWNWTCSGSNGGSTANCSATASSHSVSASVSGSGGTISPASRTVAHNGVTTFTVSPSSGNVINTVTSSGCSGSLNGTLYTTEGVTATCLVNATFTATNTTTTIGIVTPSPSKVGQSVAITYSVSNPGSASDIVTVKDGVGSTLCTGMASTGTCSAAFGSSGAKTLIAHYTPSGSAQASASPGTNHLVADSPALATPTLPSGVVGVPYATMLVASGGVPPYVFAASGLPTGFGLSTSGLLSGTANAVAATTVTITVTDNLNQTANRSYTLSLVDQLTIATTSLPEGLVNAPYEQILQGIGGKTPYVWSVTFGTLPGGLTLNTATGQLSGAPSNLGTSASFTVQVQDANARTATQALSLTTLQPTVVKTGGSTTLAANLTPSNGGSTCTLDDSQTRVLDLSNPGAPTSGPNNTTLPHGLFKMTVQGCTPGQTQLSVKLVYPTALPPGTQYWKYGKTAATPSDHWYVLPSAVISGNTVSFTIIDGGLGDDDLTADGSITDPGAAGSPTLAISGTPGSGQVGSSYSATLTPSHGTGPIYHWSMASGGLPAGVTLNTTSGQLSGMPTQTGTFNFTVQLVDTSNNASKTQAFAVTIASAPPVDTGPWNQSISFIGAAPSLLVGASGVISAYTTSGLPVTLGSATPSICRVSGNTVSALAAGLCSVSANQAGDANYYAAPQMIQNINISKGNQTIRFDSPPSGMVAGGTASLSATASSVLAVSLSSSTSSVCTVTGTTLTGVSAGSCSVTANQSGNADYNAAPAVTKTFNIGKVSSSTSLSADPVSEALVGQTTTVTVRVTGVAGLPTGSVVLTDSGSTLGSVALNASGSATYSGNFGVGLHNLSASYAGDAVYLSSLGSLSYRVATTLDTAMSVRTQPNLSQPGESIPIIVSLTPSRNVGALSGTIEVSSNDGLSCSITLPVDRCTLTFASKGIKRLTASYSGNAFYTAKTESTNHFVGQRPNLAHIWMLLLD